MRYIVIAIRGFPDFPVGWYGSYFVGRFEDLNIAIQCADSEAKKRGGKYGCVVYDSQTPDSDQVYLVPHVD